jgi:hypothetical protein
MVVAVLEIVAAGTAAATESSGIDSSCAAAAERETSVGGKGGIFRTVGRSIPSPPLAFPGSCSHG